MKKFWSNPVVAFLSSLKFSAFLMVIAAIASAKATFIESDYGRDAAYDLIYAAHWFEGILALLVISLTLIFFKRWPYKGRQLGFLLVHVSIVVILVASGMTRYMGFEGTMPIREGSSSDSYYSMKPHIQAELDGVSASFGVRLWRPGQSNIWHKIQLGGQDYKLGVTEYWPHFTQSYKPGPGGQPGLQFDRDDHGQMISDTLLRGNRTNIGQAQVFYRTGPFSGEVSLSKYGDLRVRVGGESSSFPVGLPDGREHECGGYGFEITEFQTSFKVGAVSSAKGPMTNPMIRVKVTGPDGTTGERLLFALHPEFSMDHGGGEDDFADLNVLYQVSSGIEFAPASDGVSAADVGLQGRATFDLITLDLKSEERGEIPAGEIFTVQEQVRYGNEAKHFSFAPTDIIDSVVLAPAQGQNPKMGSAARIVIRDEQGNESEAICRKYDSGKAVRLGDHTITLAFSPVIRTLPYSLHLDDFLLETYPGSDNPATYESYVSIDDPVHGVTGRKAHIYMNSPLNYRGIKHFQSSYDPDRKGTVLTLNKDPGKWPTYFGYTLLTIGFILIVAKDLLWPRRKKNSGSGAGRGTATKVAAVVFVLLAMGTPGVSALAQTGHEGHSHGPDVECTTEPNPAQTPTFVVLSDPARDQASRLLIQDYRGRMKPLDTLAREMVMKVAKKTKFQDRHPVDMYLNWTANSTYWWTQPVIAVRFAGLKDLLGVDHSVKHVSPASLYDKTGKYRLGPAVEVAHRTPDRDRTKTQRKLISFDERFNLLYMTFKGSTLRLFPVPGDANNTWLDIQTVSPKLESDIASIYQVAYTDFSQGLITGDNMRIMRGIQEMDALQHQFGAEVIPSDTQLNAELIYNRTHIFSWMMVPLLIAFMILMSLYIWNLFRNSGARLSFRNPFYSLGMFLYVVAFGGMLYAYVLRWIASDRAPLSNGHESLLFIALSVVLAGLLFELFYRMSAPAGLSALLTVVILGVSMLSVFDPAIGPLMPVLVSYWLNIHVTIITSSYGFLGLSALIGTLVLVLLSLPVSKNRQSVRETIKTLDGINHNVLVVGLGLLSIGTLLGGVWANESWGRYWGWDAKETWSLITILVYAIVLHFRWIPQIRSVWLSASGSLAAIGSVVMTYFGVNYFLAGLHSYAQGDAAQVPNWVFIFAGIVVTLITVSGLVFFRRNRSE
ncbi:MAG: cytochrome c biogenesis protein CcsA [Gemmatimonadales bacterium]|nr:cytochrome c biogenesis protein CcsA [Gemmatimonadales bacterium]